MTRNPALDGLRAVACLAVVAFHAGLPGAGIGWLGVDVFFVLSGYLITGVLLDELDRTDRISLARFYVRRAARLYPALILAVAAALLLPHPVGAREVVVTLTYLTDMARAFGHDTGPLGHAWSLAVEEHFYLAWPLVVLFVRTRRAVAACAAAGAAGSLGLLVAADGLGSMGNLGYNSTPTRVWELLLGCLLAATADRIAPRRPVAVILGAVVPPTAALALLASGCPTDAWPVWMSLVTAWVTSGLLLASRTIPLRVLAAPPLASLGRVSYGIYLYHFVALALAGHRAPWPAGLAVSVGLSVPLAYASHRWIEQPTQRWARSVTYPAGTSDPRSATSAARSAAASSPSSAIAASAAATAESSTV